MSRLALPAAALAFAVATAAVQPVVAVAQSYAQPVVQPLPDPAAARLSDALRRLAQDPRSVAALVDAGMASVALDDIEAAQGFFNRAQTAAPNDGRVKAGLASVLVRQQQPVEALRLFAEAEQAGEPMRFHAAERGLAYDLIGDNTRAQAEYYVFLSLGEDPLVTRRLALSQAIAGDQRASEATLLPLLQRTDLAAYRTRAFALAIGGRTEEAVSIAETMLPARLSSRMAPYLRYMPRLTRAQQAAAANLGMFPQAAQIGRDDPALAALAQPAAPRPQQQTVDSRLVPAGQPLGAQSTVRDGAIPRREEVRQPVQVAALPAEQYGPPATVISAPPPEQEAPRASFSVAEAAAQPPPQPAAPPVAQPSLTEAFAEFTLPEGAGTPAVAASGAVDITQIRPRREAPPAAAPPTLPRPVHPSRQWVQVATGRDTGALAFDWRRIKREADGLLDRSSAFTARWGQTNRLVIGPFGSSREADTMVNRLKGKDIDSFRFTSEQGQEVKPLG